MAAQTQKAVEQIRGRSEMGLSHRGDIEKLIEHIAAVEALLDEVDAHEGMWGDGGWRHHLGIDE